MENRRRTYIYIYIVLLSSIFVKHALKIARKIARLPETNYFARLWGLQPPSSYAYASSFPSGCTAVVGGSQAGEPASSWRSQGGAGAAGGRSKRGRQLPKSFDYTPRASSPPPTYDTAVELGIARPRPAVPGARFRRQSLSDIRSSNLEP